jgi:hypothetical protein
MVERQAASQQFSAVWILKAQVEKAILLAHAFLALIEIPTYKSWWEPGGCFNQN